MKNYLLKPVLFIVLILLISSCGKKEEQKLTENKTTTQTQQTPSNTTIKTSPAEITVRDWIGALGNQNFKKAHELMTSQKGGDYSKFSSTIAYGGINKTNIISCSVDNENESNTEVIAEYEAFDPINHDGKFKQRFILVKQGEKWLISDIKNINISFYNEKKKEDIKDYTKDYDEEKSNNKKSKTYDLEGCFYDDSYKAQYVMDKFGKGTCEYSTSLFGGAIIKGKYKINGDNITFNLNDGQSFTVKLYEDNGQYYFYRGKSKYSKSK